MATCNIQITSDVFLTKVQRVTSEIHNLQTLRHEKQSLCDHFNVGFFAVKIKCKMYDHDSSQSQYLICHSVLYEAPSAYTNGCNELSILRPDMMKLGFSFSYTHI